jgi:hypothetical protein
MTEEEYEDLMVAMKDLSISARANIIDALARRGCSSSCRVNSTLTNLYAEEIK